MKNSKLRDSYDFDVKKFLYSMGVDYRQGTVDAESIRSKLFKEENDKKKLVREVEFLNSVFNDPKTMHLY